MCHLFFHATIYSFGLSVSKHTEDESMAKKQSVQPPLPARAGSLGSYKSGLTYFICKGVTQGHGMFKLERTFESMCPVQALNLQISSFCSYKSF